MRRHMLSLVLLLPVMSGCATGLAGGDKIIKFHAHDDPVIAKVHHAGDYVVVYRDFGSGDLWQAHGLRRTLKKGDDLGFARDPSGNLVAIAGGEERTLGPMPVIAQYAAWYRLPDDYDRNRRLRKDLHSAASTVTTAAVPVTKAAVIGGAAFGAAAIESAADDPEGERTDKRNNQKRRHHDD